MEKVNKRDFPNFARLPYAFDLEVLKQTFLVMRQKKFSDVVRRSVEARSDVAQYFPFDGQKYKYIPLNYPVDIVPEKNIEDFENLSSKEKIKTVLTPNIENPLFDERAYNKYYDEVSPKFILELKKIRAPIQRARFAILEKDSYIHEHIDSPLHISTRIHIPLETNQGCLFTVKRNSEYEDFYMPADGHAYFINTALPHKACNKGGDARVHLVLSLGGVQDILHLKKNQDLHE